jgi:hypothetical protein
LELTSASPPFEPFIMSTTPDLSLAAAGCMMLAPLAFGFLAFR